MSGRKKRASKKPAAAAGKRYGGAAPPAVTGRVAEPAVLIRRKNFDLDQHRLDRVRVALGAKTEREAITRAMDIALDVAAFEHEVAAGSNALYGMGGFENTFDEAGALDFSSFLGERGGRGGRGGSARRGR